MIPILNDVSLRDYLSKFDCDYQGVDPIAYSACSILYGYHDQLKDYKTIVEIGTFRGMSALVFASWGLAVHTFDVEEKPSCKPLFEGLNIHQHIIRDREHAREIIAGMEFDCAFIDAVHDYENVAADFELVKRCGCVLFHDYNPKDFPGVYKFVNEIHGTPGPYSAIWIRSD